VFHPDNALELLDEPSFSRKCIVRHIESPQQLSFFFYVVNNLDFIVAFSTILKSIVQNAAIEPGLVVKDVPFGVIVVFE
jgi:hypothetical protein